MLDRINRHLTGLFSNRRLDRTLRLTTDKQEYSRGETVTFTAKNLGSGTLVFPDSALGIGIRNVDTGDSYGIIAAQVLTEIEGGRSVRVAWQHEGEGVQPGNYVASIKTASRSSPTATAETSFRISDN